VPAICAATVQYTVTPDPGTSSLSVSVRIEHPRPVESFSIPGWSPGFYVMQHYERRVGIVGANQGTAADKISRVGSRTWTVKIRGGAPLTFNYRVQGNDSGLGFFGTYVRGSEAYYNGPSAYMYVAGRRDETCTLRVKVPKGWDVATALDSVGPNKWTAPNYDTLADFPVQMGEFDVRKFSENGIPYEAIFVWPEHSVHNFDIDAQMKVIEKVSLPAIKLFGGASFKRYLYIFHLTGIGFQGGLEHRAGTVIAVANVDGDDISDLVAHEEFHAWNVKQIRPRPLGPFNYTAPQRTGNLWFAEGVTDYYAKLLTYRSGVHDKQWLYDQLSQQIGSLQLGETRKTSTVEDASRQVWENNGFDLGDLSY
jgi:predicted metalloprotease with PDZ domain